MTRSRGSQHGPSEVHSPVDKVVLSDVQAEVLRLFTVERLTPRLVARRRGTTLRSVYKVRRWLIEKGLMDSRFNEVHTSGFTCEPSGAYSMNWTLHALQYNVRIISGFNERFYSERVGSVVAVRGSTVMLFPRKLVVNVGQVFESDHPEKAAWKASDYLFSLLRVLENDFGVLLLKDRSQNVRRTRGEFSRMNDTLALKPGAAQIKVFCGEDGKLRVKVDWSPGSMPEVEMLHAVHGQGDASKYEDFLRDLVEHPSFNLSQLSGLVYQVQLQQVAVSKQIGQLADLIRLDIESRRVPGSVFSEPDVSELRRYTG